MSAPTASADARTGITAAIIVLVFCAGQFALLLAGIVIARGFRLPGAAARRERTPSPRMPPRPPRRWT